MTKASKTQKKKFYKRIPSIAAICICVILALLLTMNLTIIIKSYINPNEVPDFFGIKPFIVLSGSMEPTILTGDIAIVKKVAPNELVVGDIISFKEGNLVVTHRIVELTQNNDEPAFFTQGDANNARDQSPVTYEQVEGIYLFRINRLGELVMFVQTPLGMLIFAGIPLIGFILYDLLRRKYDNEKENTRYDEAQAEIERLKAELEEKSGGHES